MPLTAVELLQSVGDLERRGGGAGHSLAQPPGSLEGRGQDAAWALWREGPRHRFGLMEALLGEGDIGVAIGGIRRGHPTVPDQPELRAGPERGPRRALGLAGEVRGRGRGERAASDEFAGRRVLLAALGSHHVPRRRVSRSAFLILNRVVNVGGAPPGNSIDAQDHIRLHR